MNDAQFDCNVLPVSYLMEEYEKCYNKKLDLEKLLLLFYEHYDIALFVHFSFSNNLLSMGKGIKPIHKDNFDFYLSCCDLSGEFGYLYPEESSGYKNVDVECKNKICDINEFDLEGVIKFSYYDNYFTAMKSENFVLREITKFSGYFNFFVNGGLKLNKKNLTLSNFSNKFTMKYDLVDRKFCPDDCVLEYYISKMEVTFNDGILNDLTLDFVNDIYVQKEKIDFIIRNIDKYTKEYKKEKQKEEKVQEQEDIHKAYLKIKEENKKLKRENKKLLKYENIINGLIHMHNPKFYKPNQEKLFNENGKISINAISETIHRITNKLIESGYPESDSRSVSTLTNTLNEFVYKLPE
nr:MAG TPA: hypothetical protein [Caudoviricetes sp.]DAT61165.1 MAG TPA: hypothetical protein [Caudoviricetes sp.]